MIPQVFKLSFLIFNTPRTKNTTATGAHLGDDDAEEADENPGDEESDASFDPADNAAEESAAKLRKRAGVPELELDQLPSAITIKTLTLIYSKLMIPKKNKTLDHGFVPPKQHE